MNGYDIEEDDLDSIFEEDDLDELEELLENFGEEDDDLAERRRRRRRRVSPARGTGLFRPKPTKGFVTQTQLKAAMARVGKDIRKNAMAIKKVNTSINALSARQERDTRQLRKDLQKSNQMSLLTLLLQKPPTVELTKSPVMTVESPSQRIDVVTDVKLKEEDNTLLLLLAFMGQGTGGGLSGDNLPLLLIALKDKEGIDTNTLLILMLAGGFGK